MNLVEYPDAELMMLRLADRLAGEIGDFLRRQHRISLAVPGGTTPGPVFDVLSAVDLDWARVTVLPTDERWVGPDSPRSNAALIRDRLLTGRAAAASFVPLWAPEPTPEAALDTLIAAAAPHLPPTMLLLGMGADAHIASLFPGADRLAEALAPDAPPLMAIRAPAAPEPRVTLTAPMLTGALSTHLLITGPEKRATIEAAAGRAPAEAPVRLILSQATIHWAP